MGDYLPVCQEDMEKRGWDQCDFVYVSGDAYVDHPSFGTAIISRLLEARGYRVGIIAQPDWRDEKSFQVLGRPRLGFLVSSGNMDSMVNHYSVSKKRRHKDSYTPGGIMGKRPDHAVVVYCNRIRSVYKEIPIIIGGIEASLRRLAHYDYWSDQLKRSVLLDSQADILSYGMGEHSIMEIAEALEAGIDVKQITFVDGTVFCTRSLKNVRDYEMLPDYEEMRADKKKYAFSFGIQYRNTDPFTGKRLVEPYSGRGRTEYVVQNPPSKPLSVEEMDEVYGLSYMRSYHPSYEAAGGVPAVQEIKFSLISNRGCFGACSFCALTFHQGRIIQARSHDSLMEEAKKLIQEPDFKGYIHDVGGPTANFRFPACEKQEKKGACTNKQCLFPVPCKNLRADHRDYIALLRKLRSLPGVKKVFIRSGIRFDYLLADKSREFLRELCQHHVSGQLKVAPEHVSDAVLSRMGKPANKVYRQFVREYEKMNERLGKDQYLVPYLMSSHPGSTLKEAVELAEYLRTLGYMPEQVQDFYPTPSTISTCMYYTGVDPRTMEEVYVPVKPREKAMQRALIQYRDPKNYDLVTEALRAAGRADLIGYDKKCLVRPRGGNGEDHREKTKQTGGNGRGQSQRSSTAFREAARQDNGKERQKEKGTVSGKNEKRRTIRNIHRKKGKADAFS